MVQFALAQATATAIADGRKHGKPHNSVRRGGPVRVASSRCTPIVTAASRGQCEKCWRTHGVHETQVGIRKCYKREDVSRRDGKQERLLAHLGSTTMGQ